MNKDDPILSGDLPEAPKLPTRPTPPWVYWLTGLALALVCAELIYRFYDVNSSPEVRPGGVALKGVAISGRSFTLPLAPPDAFHSLHISLTANNADDADAEAARMGILGVLMVTEETGAGRRWDFPIRIQANPQYIVRHAAVENALLPESSKGLIGLGHLYRIDYSITDEPPGGTQLEQFSHTEFPAGTRLSLRFIIDLPLPPETLVFVSYARAPRLLHEALLRQ